MVLVVLTTCDQKEVAQRITQAVLHEGVAACVHTEKVSSDYLWQGKQEQGQEWRLMIKTTQAQYAKLEACISAHHTYEVPEIIALPVTAGAPAYLQWVNDSCQGKTDGIA